MAIALSPHPVTLRQTFSFYVSGKDSERIRACAEKADAVVASGSSGPASVQRLRSDGWTGTVLFDRAAYSDHVGGFILPTVLIASLDRCPLGIRQCKGRAVITRHARICACTSDG